MNNFYKKYPRKDDVKQIVENSERYFIPDLITLVNKTLGSRVVGT